MPKNLLANTHESLVFSSLPPAAVTVTSTAPRRVAFLVLACNGLQQRNEKDVTVQVTYSKTQSVKFTSREAFHKGVIHTWVTVSAML